MRYRGATFWALLLGAAIGCADAPTETAVGVPRANLQATKFWDALATTRWNLRATDLHQTLPPPPNGQAWASRMLTYLSIAQYRAALAATAPSNRRAHPSVSAAVARASVTVLREFFAAHPGVPTALESRESCLPLAGTGCSSEKLMTDDEGLRTHD